MTEEHMLEMLNRAVENDELSEHEAWLEWQLFQEQENDEYE